MFHWACRNAYLSKQITSGLFKAWEKVLKNCIGLYNNCVVRLSNPDVCIIKYFCRQCLPLSVVQLKGKHCRKPHCHNGVVDHMGHSLHSLSETGNEDVLENIEITTDNLQILDTNGSFLENLKFFMESADECQEECQARYIIN